MAEAANITVDKSPERDACGKCIFTRISYCDPILRQVLAHKFLALAAPYTRHVLSRSTLEQLTH